jgi:hypothetical protein
MRKNRVKNYVYLAYKADINQNIVQLSKEDYKSFEARPLLGSLRLIFKIGQNVENPISSMMWAFLFILFSKMLKNARNLDQHENLGSKKIYA